MTSIKSFTSSSFFNASPAVIFFHLLLSLAPLRFDWLPRHLVGHVALNWNKVVSKFLQLTNYYDRLELKKSQSWCWIGTRKTCKLFFLWRCKSYNMDENILEKLDNKLHVKVKKCVKRKHACVFYFPNQPECVHY